MWLREGNLLREEPPRFDEALGEAPFDWYGESEVSRRSAEYARWVQNSLNRLIDARLVVDGIVGPVTRAAIRQFQQRTGIRVDGIVGPETERTLIANGASLPPGAGAAPAPAPSPMPVPAAGLRGAIVRIAREEWDRWNKGGRKTETDSAMLPVLREYWAAVGQNFSESQLADPSFQGSWPWSAAFVSWVMKRAGAGSGFAYSASHAAYVIAAKDSRTRNTPGAFKAYRINEAAPAPGDVVCKGRSGTTVTFDNVRIGMPTHGDIVVGREGNQLVTIGGNVSNSVSITKVSVDAAGRITDRNYFAVLQAPEAAVTVAPTPVAPSGFFKDLAALRNTPLTPQRPIAEPSTGSAKALATTYNRLGGLMSLLSAQAGIEIPAILAVWYVESAGRAHSPGNAIIRFENHLFFNLWGKAHPEIYDRHFRHGGREGVAGRGWENHQFRDNASRAFEKCHTSQQHEYRVLGFARRLDDNAALKSISIGGPQILINNHPLIGYVTPLSMYEAFQSSERYHVLGFMDFCARQPSPKQGQLLGYLRARDWPSFARYYNGSGQVELYAGKLRSAYDAAKTLSLGA